MTVSSTVRKTDPFIGNGLTTQLPFAFKVFKKQDVLVVEADATTGAESTLTLDTDYSVVLNTNQDGNPGGTVTLAVALAMGKKAVVSSRVALTQNTDITNQGGFQPQIVEDSLDRLTIITQQLQEQVSRSAKLPITNSADADMLVADIMRVADSASNIDTVAGSIGNVNLVAGDLANVNIVAADKANIDIVAGDKANIDAVVANKTNIDAVAGNAANINAVSADLANVNLVAGDKVNIDAVAGNKANIDAVAGNATNINLVAGDKANIDIVAANQAPIHALGNDLTGSPMVVDYGDLSTATNPASPTGAIGAVYANLAVIQSAPANAATAAAKADIATAQAVIATEKAGVSTDKAAIATTQAGVATTQAGIATAKADSTAALLASFRSVLLGSFTTDANAVAFAAANGITITDGIMYENSVSDKFRIYNGTAWQDYDSSAQVSQSAAALSAANAATSESNAGNSANTATTQAGISTTQAGISATKAGESANSAAQSLSYLNSFKGTYYGPLASDPVLDPLGNPVGVGDLYLNTTVPEMRVYNGASWMAAYVSLAGALLKANNLSDLQNVISARNNLGLGALAVKDTVGTSDIDNEAITAAKLAATLDLGALV